MKRAVRRTVVVLCLITFAPDLLACILPLIYRRGFSGQSPILFNFEWSAERSGRDCLVEQNGTFVPDLML